jgi:hypothetical protein
MRSRAASKRAVGAMIASAATVRAAATTGAATPDVPITWLSAMVT